MRIRTTKPDFYSDEKLGRNLTREQRGFFQGLWSVADDEGRARAHPAYLRSQLYPYDDDLSVSTVAEWVRKLEALGCIQLYESDGEQYLFVVHLRRHQVINKPSKSRLPEPPVVKKPRVVNGMATSNGALPEHYSSPPAMLRETSHTEREREVGKGKESPPIPPAAGGGVPVRVGPEPQQPPRVAAAAATTAAVALAEPSYPDSAPGVVPLPPNPQRTLRVALEHWRSTFHAYGVTEAAFSPRAEAKFLAMVENPGLTPMQVQRTIEGYEQIIRAKHFVAKRNGKAQLIVPKIEHCFRDIACVYRYIDEAPRPEKSVPEPTPPPRPGLWRNTWLTLQANGLSLEIMGMLGLFKEIEDAPHQLTISGPPKSTAWVRDNYLGALEQAAGKPVSIMDDPAKRNIMPDPDQASPGDLASSEGAAAHG